MAIFGGYRVGTTVVMEELVRRLATSELSVFTFFPSFSGDAVRAQREKEGYTFGMGGVETVFFMADGHPSRDAFDTVVVLSPAVAAMKIWPAIDPLTSASRWLRRFFAQPFFIAEPYTKRPGSFVPRADAVVACAAILDGVHDAVPEDAFYFTGGIDEVLARANA